jgi:hypothetical protein
MSDSTLRSRLIHLASVHPHLRASILPILKGNPERLAAAPTVESLMHSYQEMDDAYQKFSGLLARLGMDVRKMPDADLAEETLRDVRESRLALEGHLEALEGAVKGYGSNR